jgi:hypothetical protein
MVYNPVHQKWEGNEEVLLDFDKVSAASVMAVTRLRPALITNKGGASKLPQVVGNMVFDPVQMRWINNEEEEDVFAGIDDDLPAQSNAPMKIGWFLSTCYKNVFAHLLFFKLDPLAEFPELRSTKSLKQSLYISESSHKLFIGKWYPRAVMDSKTIVRDTSKVHLHDIRQVRVGSSGLNISIADK